MSAGVASCAELAKRQAETARRRKEVVRRVALGQSDRDIAAALDLDFSSVANIRRRAGITRRDPRRRFSTAERASLDARIADLVGESKPLSVIATELGVSKSFVEVALVRLDLWVEAPVKKPDTSAFEAALAKAGATFADCARAVRPGETGIAVKHWAGQSWAQHNAGIGGTSLA